MTLDDQANDRLSGAAGETDNVHGDIEFVNAEAETVGGMVPPSGNDTFVGNAAVNSSPATAATTPSTAGPTTTS